MLALQTVGGSSSFPFVSLRVHTPRQADRKLRDLFRFGFVDIFPIHLYMQEDRVLTLALVLCGVASTEALETGETDIESLFWCLEALCALVFVDGSVLEGLGDVLPVAAIRVAHYFLVNL